MVNPILYTIHLSPPCRAVEMCAKALGIELDQKVVDLLGGEQLKPEFLKMNPQHTVPVLDDNGTIISDSHAIMIYLVSKYGGGQNDDALYPKDLAKQAKVNAALHFESGVLFARLRFITEALFFRHESEIAPEKIEYVQKAYQLLEDTLANDYVAGNALTIADFSCVSTVSSICDVIPLERSKYPRIHGWMDRLKALPYYEEANGSGAVALGGFILATIEKNAGGA